MDCCNDFQIVVIGTHIISLIIVLVLSSTTILRPLRLLSVYLHELSHACAAWITCGTVMSIRIDDTGAGATKVKGGIRWVILPAGYIGSGLWGAFFSLMAASSEWTGRYSVRIAMVIMLCIMIYVVIFKQEETNKTHTQLLLIVYIVVFSIMFLTDEFNAMVFGFHWMSTIFLILFGTINSLFAILDIWTDLIRRDGHASDATKFEESFPCLTAKGWGIVWCVVCVVTFCCQLFLSVFLAQLGSGEHVISSVFWRFVASNMK